MGIVLHSEGDRERLRRAGAAAAATLAGAVARIRPGMPTADVDAFVRRDTKARGGRPSQLGYKGFPAAVCVSPNAVVCHGIPSRRLVLREGDIVNVDVTTELDGFHGDTSVTVVVGEPSAATSDALRVLETARAGLEAGIAAVRPGGRLGDVGAAILEVASAAGCTVVTDFGGHGIGRRMHMEPHVPHVGRRGRGPRLRPGMAFTIEPMIVLGNPPIRILEDGWTAVTANGSPSAQFEHTVLVTEAGCEVLTRRREGAVT